MRDKETGTWWQQINGKAIYGPLKGASLDLVPYDELTFGEWKSEVFGGQVFSPVAKYKKEYDPNWEPEIAKLPVVISFPGTELKSRDVVVGIEVDGASRCYPWDALVKQSPIMDHAGGKPVLIAVAPDGKSFRAFVSRIEGRNAEFFLKSGTDPAPPSSAGVKPESSSAPPAAAKSAAKSAVNGSAGVSPAVAGATSPSTGQQGLQPANATAVKPADPAPKPWVLLDSTTASEWNFQGCAVSGPAQGKCLERIPILKDYWFDWRNYHPDTTIYKR
jgi:Protein of unknown function (DUF3179)